MDKDRLFLGIPLDENYASSVYNSTSLLSDDIWRKTKINNLHLTVLFIGDVDPDFTQYIEEIAENISNRTRAFSLIGGRTRIMKPDEPTMLWIRYERNRWFEKLVTDAENCFKKIGTWERHLLRNNLKDKTPIPHITLARIRGGGMLDSLLPPVDTDNTTESFTARSLVLYKSIRNPEGETDYEILKKWDFKKE